MLRDCPTAAGLWKRLLPQNHTHQFFQATFPEWLYVNLSQKNSSIFEVPWNIVFGTTCWYVRKWTNPFIFEGREISIGGQLSTIKSMAVATWNNRLTCPLQNGRPARQEGILVGWVSPPVDWIALNSDGAYRSRRGVASAGGVLRHLDGSWIMGYACNSGTSTAYRAELWGVFQGLKLAWELGYRRINVQVDNKTVVHALNTQSMHPCSNSDVIRAIKDLLSRQ